MANPGAYKIGGPPRRAGMELVSFAQAAGDTTELSLHGLNGDRDRLYHIYWYGIGVIAGTCIWKLWANGRTGDTAGQEILQHDSSGTNGRTTNAYVSLLSVNAIGDLIMGFGTLICHPRQNKMIAMQRMYHTPGSGYRYGDDADGYWANTDNLTWLLLKCDVEKGIGAGGWVAVYRDPMFGGRRDRD